MIRLGILILNFFGLLSINFLFTEDVSLNMNVPSSVNAGMEFNVEVTVKKGSVESFARYQQDLPLGLTAQVIDPAQADFSFENQKVKFIWLRLPSDKELKISYRVKVDERLKGQFDIKGLFSYIEGNERKTVNASSNVISIQPSNRIDPNLIVDIKEFQQMIPAQQPVSLLASNVRCIRQQPVPSGDGNNLLVNVLVSKGSTEKFAKIEEEIPQGYIAEAVQTKDAIFTFKDNKVKLLWMNLPPEQRFVVTYKLIPQAGAGELKLKGTFSFILNGATQVIDIVQRDADLTNPNPKYLDGIIATVPVPTLSRIEGGKATSSSSFTEPGADGGKDMEVKYQKIEEKPRAAVAKPIDMMSFMLEPEKGVYFRVQVAAGHRPVDIKRYFKKYRIPGEIRTEEHDGWYKYSIGSFPEYKEARDYRVKLWNTTPVKDAFVSAYNNGKRITVQEALMITNQKWYR